MSARAAADAAARRRAARARQQRHRQLVRDGKILVRIEIDGPKLDLLIKLHWLRERDSDNAGKIGAAIEAMLSEAAR
jgi:hypothetical protein